MDLNQLKRKPIIVPSDYSSQDNEAWSKLVNEYSSGNFNSRHPVEEEKKMSNSKPKKRQINVAHPDVPCAFDDE